MSLQEMYYNALKEICSRITAEVISTYSKYGFEQDKNRKVSLEKSDIQNVWDLIIPIAEERGRIFSLGCGMLNEGNIALGKLANSGDRIRATVYDIYDDRVIVELKLTTPNLLEVQ